MTVGDLKIGNTILLATDSDGLVIVPTSERPAHAYIVTGYGNNCTYLETEGFEEAWGIPDKRILNHKTLKLIEQIELKPTMNPVSVKDLVGYKDGIAVACAEGTLVKLFKVNEGTGANGKYFLQNGVLQDANQDEFPITFASEGVIQPTDMWKKRIHIECKAGQKGSTGLKIKKNSKSGELGLWVTETAQITYPDGKPASANTGSTGAASAAPKGQDSPSTGSGSATGGQSAPRAQESHSARDQSTVRDRCYLYMLVLGEVHYAYKQGKVGDSDLLPELSPTDLKDIATHISMTYRGDYGAYAKPVFELAGPTATPVTESGKVIEPKVEDWKEVMTPKSGKKLSEFPLAKQWELWQWGLVNKPETPEAVRMRTALLLMGDALGMNAVKYVNMHLKALKLENAEAMDDYCNQEYGVSAAELSPDNWTDLTTKLRTKDGDGPLVLHIKNFSPEPDEPPFTPDEDPDGIPE